MSSKLQMSDYLLICSSQSSGGGGLSATVRANKTCRSHSFITLRALWLSYRGIGNGVTISTSMTGSESLRKKKDLKKKLKWNNSSVGWIKRIIYCSGVIYWSAATWKHYGLSTLITNNGKSFLTHIETSVGRRGLTNSDLVGRALLASGWAFHGLA